MQLYNWGLPSLNSTVPLVEIPLVRNKVSSFFKEVLCFILLYLLHSFNIQLNCLMTGDMWYPVFGLLKEKCHIHLFCLSTHLQIIDDKKWLLLYVLF